jgi:pilus assembly protein CpaE
MVEAGHTGCQVSTLNPLDLVTGQVTQARPELLVLVLSPDPEPALALLRAVRAAVGRVLVVGPGSESKLVLRALREGADQYVDEAELRAELKDVLGRLKAQAQPAAPQAAPTGKLIAVLAPSGGSGSSTLAANMAAVLAKEHKSCLLLDLKLGAGDLAALLDLRPTHTLADLCRNATQMDRAIFDRSLVRHPCGVSLLAPPRIFADIGKVTTQGVQEVLAMARRVFPYTVADLDDYFHQEQTQTLRQADVVLIVLRLDFTSLRNAGRTLEHLQQMNIPRDRVRLVVNRYGQPKELPASKAEEALGMKISHYVPDDPKTINRANNSGVPAVLEAPSAKVSRSLVQLATSVNGQPQPR